MDVILLEKIGKLGDLGDKVTVKPGYGRNFLIPQGKAVPATKDNVEKFEARRAELEAAAAETLAALAQPDRLGVFRLLVRAGYQSTNDPSKKYTKRSGHSWRVRVVDAFRYLRPI